MTIWYLQKVEPDGGAFWDTKLHKNCVAIIAHEFKPFDARGEEIAEIRAIREQAAI